MKMISDLLPKCPWKMNFENVMKIISESLRLQEIGLNSDNVPWGGPQRRQCGVPLPQPALPAAYILHILVRHLGCHTPPPSLNNLASAPEKF